MSAFFMARSGPLGDAPLRRLLRMALLAGGGGGSYYTLTGSTPLTLPHSLAAAIRSLIRYGSLTQTPAPTPDAPVYPSINNGVVRMVWQGDGIAEGDGTWRRAYINTTSSTWNYYEDASSSIRIPIQSGQYRLHWDKTDTSDVGTIFRVGFAKTDTMPSTGTPVQLYKADGTTGLEVASSPQDAQTVELEVSGTGINYLIIQVSGSNSAWSSGDFGELWARISHLHLQTRQLSVDGTPEVLTVRASVSVFAPTVVYNAYVSGAMSQQSVKASENQRTYIVPCEPSTAYKFEIDMRNYRSPRCAISGFAEMPYLDRYGGTESSAKSVEGIYQSQSQILHAVDFTTGSDTRFLAFWLTGGDAENDAELYVTLSQTATVPDLFAVGDYKDEADIISGVVTRRVGKVALTSDLPWFKVTGQTGLFGVPVADGKWAANQLAVSSHYAGTVATNASMPDNTIKATHASTLAPNRISIYVKDTTHGTSLDTFKAWLDAAGVIAIFPLVTPVTESITPQALRTVDGATVVDSSAGSVEVTAEYKASEEPSAAAASGLMMARPESEDGGAADGS